ncbi:MAG: deoxyhypusine synthase family protein [Chloroflexi bacterium]|nr:deoxyhypusine synthase family protein [Chloroflexota bacterium]
MTHYQHHHADVSPLSVAPPYSVSSLVAKMEGTSFQARNLARATSVWDEMLQNDTTIFFGLAGAMIPAGMRSLMVYLVQNRLIDCLVSTGANLFHDLHETLGHPHWVGQADCDNLALARDGVSRIYDVLIPDDELHATEDFIAEFSCNLPNDRAYTTHEFLYRLGKAVAGKTKNEGMITAAARAGVPIMCPALGDSVYGTAFAAARVKHNSPFLMDVAQDVVDMIKMVSFSMPNTGVVFIGGGTPKNFTQQAGLCTYLFDKDFKGHQFAIQITSDNPQWGGLSGCTFGEAQSWRKVAADAKSVTVYSDATIALPLMVTALAERANGQFAKRKKRASLRDLLVTPTPKPA